MSNIKEHIENFLSEETIELIDDVNKIVNVEDLKKTATIAQRIYEDITSCEQLLATNDSTSLFHEQLKEEQLDLGQALQSAISIIQNHVLEHTDKLENTLKDKLQQVRSVSEQLLNNITRVNIIEVMESKEKENTSRKIEENDVKEAICKKDKSIDLQRSVDPEQILEPSGSNAVIEQRPDESITKFLNQQLEIPEQVSQSPVLILAQSGE